MNQQRSGQLNKTEVFQRKKSKWPKTHEKILTVPGYKGNENQNHAKIPLRSC
jgi:hypothetical protein